MIPNRELAQLRARFQRDLQSRLRIDFFTNRTAGLAVPGRECPHCDDVQSMLEDMAGVSAKLRLTVHDFYEEPEAAKSLAVDKIPATVIRGKANRPLRFFGVPSGGQFSVLVETIVAASSGNTGLALETVRALRKLRSDVMLQVLVTPSCKFSPAAAFNAFRFGLQSVRVKVDVVDVTQFPGILQRIGVPAVPLNVINDAYATPGVVDEGELAQALLQAAEGKDVTVRSRAGTVTMLGQQRRQGTARPGRSPSGLYLPR